jgi:GNAT superfamily N-acetyltransferase
MSAAVVSPCRAAEIFDDPDSTALFAEYERECANPLTGTTAPQRAMYEAIEGLGLAQCFAARADGLLCGCAFVLIAAVPHYGRRFATVESLFVLSGARMSGLGRQLMYAVEAHAQEAGCSAIFYSAPVASRLAKLLSLLDGYRNTNLIFTRSLA